jgi:hypothetical protein
MSMKLGFVIPWYEEDISGGAESLCRSVVHALRESGLSVEVLTTCVREFASDWNHDFHPEGTTVEGGVVVRRFRVRQRHTARFHEVNYKLMHEIPLTTKEEETFVTEMINSPKLCKYIRKHHREYVFLFIPYMFGTTYWGSRECPDGAILIPCLHDEAYARMLVFRSICERARGLVFNSTAERRLAERLYSLDPERLRVAGVPVNCDRQSNPQRFRSKYGMSDFFLYAGRTEKGKGAELLVEYFCRYLGETGRMEQLVFIGGGELQIPEQYQSRLGQPGLPARTRQIRRLWCGNRAVRPQPLGKLFHCDDGELACRTAGDRESGVRGHHGVLPAKQRRTVFRGLWGIPGDPDGSRRQSRPP